MAPAASQAATAAGAPAAGAPLPAPAMTTPLQTAAPFAFSAGPLGTLDLTGVFSGMGMVQSNWLASDAASQWDISNAQVFVQKTTGWFQFYLQGGAYNLAALGTPFLSTSNTLGAFYGPLPVGYVTLAFGNFSVEAGRLPTLIGAEDTFSFENLNIERGLLWNQENAVNRGVQLNGSWKRLSAAVSWNDGFYSNRFTWVTGTVSLALNAANMLTFTAGGNAGQTKFQTAATPVQNNSRIYEILYAYKSGNWFVEPYWQYTDVPTNAGIGIAQGATTDGGALLLNYNFPHGVSLALRPEYIATSGSAANGAVNLLYGPGSGAWSLTVTPTYQKGDFFLRAELSVVQANGAAPGDAFGQQGLNNSQTRGVAEAGFLF